MQVANTVKIIGFLAVLRQIRGYLCQYRGLYKLLLTFYMLLGVFSTFPWFCQW